MHASFVQIWGPVALAVIAGCAHPTNRPFPASVPGIKLAVLSIETVDGEGNPRPAVTEAPAAGRITVGQEWRPVEDLPVWFTVVSESPERLVLSVRQEAWPDQLIELLVGQRITLMPVPGDWSAGIQVSYAEAQVVRDDL